MKFTDTNSTDLSESINFDNLQMGWQVANQMNAQVVRQVIKQVGWKVDDPIKYKIKKETRR